DWGGAATTMLSPVTTAASRNRAHAALRVPRRTSSAREWARSTNRRMLTAQWRRVMSGMTTWSREPSLRVASTNGARQVYPAPAGPEHELDQVVDLFLAEHGGRQARPPGFGHEYLAGLVDPDLLDVRVVEERLGRAPAA